MTSKSTEQYKDRGAITSIWTVSQTGERKLCEPYRSSFGFGDKGGKVKFLFRSVRQGRSTDVYANMSITDLLALCADIERGKLYQDLLSVRGQDIPVVRTYLGGNNQDQATEISISLGQNPIETRGNIPEISVLFSVLQGPGQRNQIGGITLKDHRNPSNMRIALRISESQFNGMMLLIRDNYRAYLAAYYATLPNLGQWVKEDRVVHSMGSTGDFPSYWGTLRAGMNP